MREISNYTIYSFILLCFFASCNSVSDRDHELLCDKNQITSSFLLTVSQAKDQLSSDEDIILIEVSDATKYNKEHLPGAINLWRPDFRSKSNKNVKGWRCSKKELEELLSNLGVDSTTTLIIYDTKGSVDAFRLTWVLDLYGFENHKVINGGLTSWKQAGYNTTTEPSSQKAMNAFTIQGGGDSTLVASLEDVSNAISDPETIIIDTREAYEYLGQPFIAGNKIHKYKKGAFTHGCIPSAIHLNWSDLSDLSGDHRIKCKKDMIYNLEQIGATPDKNIIVYCQSGSRSSHTAFVLRHILDYPNVKNYDGSWIEWSGEFINNGSVAIEQKTNKASFNKMISDLKLTLKENKLKKNK